LGNDGTILKNKIYITEGMKQIMHERYDSIISNIKQARINGNAKLLKLWTNKLNKWQLEYGAYQPVRHYSNTG
jgi:hypothetical protein